MSTVCRELQAALASAGPQVLREDEASHLHVAECSECFDFLEAVAELETGLTSLPRLDAPQSAVEALMARPELGVRASSRRALAWAGAAAAAFLLAVSVTRLWQGQRSPDLEPLHVDVATTTPATTPLPPPKAPRPAPPRPPRREPSIFTEVDSVGSAIASQAHTGIEQPAAVESAAIGDAPPTPVAMPEEIREEVSVVAHREVVDLESHSVSPKFGDEFVKDLPIPGRLYQNVLTLAPGVSADDGDGNIATRGSRVGDFKIMVGGVGNVDPLTGLAMNSINAESIEELEVVSAGAGVDYGRAQGGYSAVTQLPDIAPARACLRERSSTENLQFIEPRGYWANTYVPGDPLMRLLADRLAVASRPSWPASFKAAPRLHEASHEAAQPFDAPAGAALAVYLSADRRNVAGEARMLVQVGIEGTPRRGGRRPAMNLTVVLDLRGEIPVEAASSMRALVGAIAAAREQGDRLNLVVAGRPGGLVIGPEKFRHGPLMVALDRLLSGTAPQAESLGIVDAVTRAIHTVASADDPDRPLGSSAVLLVTGQPLGDAAERIAELAHRSAVDGFPVSIVGVGATVVPAEIDRVSLAGQGRRRLMKNAAEASGLIDRELSAVTRAIAGAVRLRIRLADGVKLVGVLGSAALDEAHAQKVRAAEQSIDRRLARTLGVAADRGKDEDGIQVFIPNFYASDTHVILLDVVAAGPGPIADVQVRYKDLVALRNGIARATLSVGRGEDVAGPIERNVLANFLALQLSDALEEAGSALASGDRSLARKALGDMRDQLAGVRREVAGFGNDPDLAEDFAMLDEYIALLGNDAASGAGPIAYLSDSLRYAARLKLLPRPVSD